MTDPDWQKTLEGWVRHHADAVFAYLFRMTGSASVAEDLAQEVFLTALQKGGQIREPERVRGWLYTVARNAYLASRRAAKTAPVVTLTEPGELPEETDRASHLDFDEERLQQALAELPPDYRVVLMMFYFEELSYREIADQLHLPLGTVMSRLSRAKSQLKSKLLGAAVIAPSVPE